MTEVELRKLYGDAAVDALKRQLDEGASPLVDVDQLKLDLAGLGSEVDIAGLLQGAEAAGWLKGTEHFYCPVEECGRALDPEMVEAKQCPHCGTDYRESGDVPQRRVAYQSLGPLSRSVAWLIAVHGFNTAGTWQELFSWLVASLYRYRAPVLIYKYGLVRVGVLFKWRHRMLARQLGRRIQRAVEHAEQQQIHDPPDIIIHSFGSQLFRLILEMNEFSDLKFGRVIAVGSVIRPDFEWTRYIQAGRLEAVLNHRGGRDRAVPWAQFAIPDTGPAGRHGFTDAAVINVLERQGGHSSAFEKARLLSSLTKGGVWERYLRMPLANFADPGVSVPRPWRPKLTLIRWLSRAFILGLLIGVVAVAACIIAWTAGGACAFMAGFRG